MTVSLPYHKKANILSLCKKILTEDNFIIRDVASFIGLLVSSLPGVINGPLFYRQLEKCKIEALRDSRGNFDDMSLSLQMLEVKLPGGLRIFFLVLGLSMFHLLPHSLELMPLFLVGGPLVMVLLLEDIGHLKRPLYILMFYSLRHYYLG